MGASEVPEGVFSSLSLRPASPVGFSSVSTGELFVAFIRLVVLRTGVLLGLFYVERLGFYPVVCGVPGPTRRP